MTTTVSTKTIAACENVSKSFGNKTNRVDAISNVSLELHAGELVTIRGKSGCGKSTLMLCIGGLQRPDTGTVTVNGQDLYALSSDRRAKFRGQHIGYVFQQFHLIPYLSVQDNVRAARLGVKTPGSDANTNAARLLERVGMSHRLHHKPSELSIGECQRVAIARALMNSPALILADEPTGNLDLENTETILKSLRDIADGGTAVAIVTHDRECDSYADRVIQLDAGRVV